MTKTLVNLTRHVIRLIAADRETVVAEVAPTTPAARISSAPGVLMDWGLPVPVAQPTVWGAIQNLPEPTENVVYIVSLFVAQVALRRDVVASGTGPNDGAVRTADGQIWGVTRLLSFVE